MFPKGLYWVPLRIYLIRGPCLEFGRVASTSASMHLQKRLLGLAKVVAETYLSHLNLVLTEAHSG
jgi:hypothetical protein